MTWYCGWYKPKYLEIGCLAGDLCASLNTTVAVGVDINEHPDWDTYTRRYEHVHFYHTDSDSFFRLNKDKFDLVFIDGDHAHEQVLRDVQHSLSALNEDGLICMHDTWPPDMGYTDPKLCGTAYKTAKILRHMPSLEVYTFPVTFGLTLVGRVGRDFPWI